MDFVIFAVSMWILRFQASAQETSAGPPAGKYDYPPQDCPCRPPQSFIVQPPPGLQELNEFLNSRISKQLHARMFVTLHFPTPISLDNELLFAPKPYSFVCVYGRRCLHRCKFSSDSQCFRTSFIIGISVNSVVVGTETPLIP